MERGRGLEKKSLLAAVAGEWLRLRGHQDDFSRGSPLRRWSYVARGRYSRQLDELFRHFPRDQVLLLRSDDLASDPQGTVARIAGFLQVAPFVAHRAYPRVFQGAYRPPSRWSPGRMLLRFLLAGETARLRRRYGIGL
jgi:hypothetical protein